MFYKYYQGQSKHYYEGVGTNLGWGGFMLGGLFGIGASQRIYRAFKDLKKEFAKGNTEITIVGYSRGAATARMFADKIYADYAKIKDDKGNFLTSPPKISFLGLFDTVASFGNPITDFEWRFQEQIPPNVVNTFHAMAICERSKGFGLDRAIGENLLEVWFFGGHGDIGGNAKDTTKTEVKDKQVKNTLRTNYSLLFMLQKAKACGVNMQIPDLAVDPNAPIHLGENEYEELKQQRICLEKQQHFNDSVAESREIKDDDVIHYSVYDHDGIKDGSHVAACLIPEKSTAVIEEKENEGQVSKTVRVQLTPNMIEKYKSVQDIYNKLNG